MTVEAGATRFPSKDARPARRRPRSGRWSRPPSCTRHWSRCRGRCRVAAQICCPIAALRCRQFSRRRRISRRTRLRTEQPAVAPTEAPSPLQIAEHQAGATHRSFHRPIGSVAQPPAAAPPLLGVGGFGEVNVDGVPLADKDRLGEALSRQMSEFPVEVDFPVRMNETIRAQYPARGAGGQTRGLRRGLDCRGSARHDPRKSWSPTDRRSSPVPSSRRSGLPVSCPRKTTWSRSAFRWRWNSASSSARAMPRP